MKKATVKKKKAAPVQKKSFKPEAEAKTMTRSTINKGTLHEGIKNDRGV